MPAADRDLLDEQAHEPLPAAEFECVDRARYGLCESGDSLPEPIVNGEIVALGDEGRALVSQSSSPVVDLPGAPLQIGEFHETSLVEINQTRGESKRDDTAIG